MNTMWIAILFDMTIYTLLGFANVKIWGKYLPASWNQKSFVIQLFWCLEHS